MTKSPLASPEPEPEPLSIDTIRAGVARFDNDFMRLRVDEVRFPNGRVGEYSVIEQTGDPRGAVIITRTATGLYGLIREYRYPVQDWVLSFAAGGVRDDTPEEAAREVREELGVEPIRMTRIGTMLQMPALSGVESDVWVAEVRTATQPGHRDPDAGGIAQWVSRHTLEKLIREGRLNASCSLAAWQMYRSSGLSATNPR